jgi:hypothetical protein
MKNPLINLKKTKKRHFSHILKKTRMRKTKNQNKWTGKGGNEEGNGDMNNQNTGKNVIEENINSGKEVIGKKIDNIKSDIGTYINKIENEITDPKNQEWVGDKIEKATESATHILKVAEPGIKELSNEVSHIIEEDSPKLIRSIGQMGKDITEVIPGVPLIYEMIDAATAFATATAMGFKSATGFMSASDEILKNAQKSKEDFLNTNSIPSIANPSNTIPTSIPLPNKNMIGGKTSTTRKKRINKNKKSHRI